MAAILPTCTIGDADHEGTDPASLLARGLEVLAQVPPPAPHPDIDLDL